MIKPGLTITKVVITKDDNFDDAGRGMECEFFVVFSNGSSMSEIIECELDDDKYSRGMYIYDGENYNQIEDWDN